MSRNGTGTYTLPAGNPVITGTTVTSTWANSTMADVSNEISNSIPRDGQAAPIANLPMGNFIFTGLGPGVTPNDSVNRGQVFNSPVFTTPYALASPAPGDSTTLLATTSFAMNMYSPNFGGIPTVPTAPVGTGGNQIASCGFAAALAMNAVLPSQPGNGGAIITTDGTNAGWTNSFCLNDPVFVMGGMQ